MANYYKLVNGTNVALSTLITGITDSNIASLFQISSNSYTTTSKTFTSSINEYPSNLGYKYNSVDISTSCIAYSTTSSGNITIPSWCNKICAVIVGSGGSGTPGSQGTTNPATNTAASQFTNNVAASFSTGGGFSSTYHVITPSGRNGFYQNNLDNLNQAGEVIQVTTYNHSHEHHNAATNIASTYNTGASGKGGKGGTFIFLNEIAVAPSGNMYVSIGRSGGRSYIQIGSSHYEAAGGVGGISTTNVSFTSVGTTSNSSTGGSSGLSSTYISTPSYGTGGDGGAGATPVGTVGAGSAGTAGLVKIYYLTG